MEDQRDVHSPDTSDGESVSPSSPPSLPSPPILPLQGAQQQQQQQQAHSRTTNFFIDNILRPDFGCKKELARAQQTSSRDHRGGGGTGGTGHPGVVVRPNHPGTPCLDSNCSSDSTSSSSAASSLALSPQSPRKTSGSRPEESPGGGTGAGGGGGGATNTSSSSSSSSVVVLNGNGNGNGTGGSGGGATATPETQPLLWPAWVYCTRYSDRPSSAKPGDEGPPQPPHVKHTIAIFSSLPLLALWRRSYDIGEDRGNARLSPVLTSVTFRRLRGE
ncbi:unnamed protein product [Merluccius merluccius]